MTSDSAGPVRSATSPRAAFARGGATVMAIVLAVILLVGCAGAPVRQVPEGERLTDAQRTRFRDAASALDAGDPAQALSVVAPLLALEPWHVSSHVLRQDALAALGRSPEAADFYRGEAARDPQDAARALLAARTMPREGGAREAAYRAAAARMGKAPWGKIALAYELSRRAREAVEEARTLTDLGFDPDAVAAERSADAAEREAETFARDAVAAAPPLAAAHGALADVLLASQERASPRARAYEALREAERAADLDPGAAASWARAGRARRRVADDEGAVLAFRTAVKIAPSDAVSWAGLGRVLLDLRRDADARNALATAASLRPDDLETAVNHGVALFRTGDLAGAEAAFLRASALAPADPRPFQALALTRAARGNRIGAASAMERYLENGGTDRDAARRFVAQMRGAPGP